METAVGFFGGYVYDGTRWLPLPEEGGHDLAEPWLSVDMHDSDISTVVYRPAEPGSGVAYLGDTPRTYFEDEAASAPTDVAREAAGLAAWWSRRQHGASEAERGAKERELAAYLAEDIDPDELDWDGEEENIDDLDDGEVFVEVKTARFLTALGLPLPADLAR
jgi:hypothetical protein